MLLRHICINYFAFFVWSKKSKLFVCKILAKWVEYKSRNLAENKVINISGDSNEVLNSVIFNLRS